MDNTPIIVLVGENDVRAPPPRPSSCIARSRRMGFPTHLYIAPREPYGWRELRHELFKVNVELDWFEKYVQNREYVWEIAPGDDEEDGDEPTGNP